jgi:hypothetical protein
MCFIFLLGKNSVLSKFLFKFIFSNLLGEDDSSSIFILLLDKNSFSSRFLFKFARSSSSVVESLVDSFEF